MLTLLGPFLRKCYCFSGCTNTRVAFFLNPGMDQLSHLDSKKSASGSHRSDIWVWDKQYPEYFGANGLSFFSSGHPITTRCWSSRAWCWTDEAMMGRSRGSLISRQSISGELTPLIFFTWFFSVRCVEDLMRRKSLKRGLGGKYLLGETHFELSGKFVFKESWH